MKFNDLYLNRTPHKTRRTSKPSIIVWHETVGTANSSLSWMLSDASKVSWEFLIARDGTVYRCLDPLAWHGWHVGDATLTNAQTIGVELEGPNDGTPITAAQRTAIIGLMWYFKDTYGIPLASDRHVSHASVATPKGRKSDPRGFDVSEVLKVAQGTQATLSYSVLKSFPAGTRYRTTVDGVNVRRIPELRQDSLLMMLPRGVGFYVDRLVEGAEAAGSSAWVHAPNLGYIHTSLVEPEPAGSDSPDRIQAIHDHAVKVADYVTALLAVIDMARRGK